MNDLINWIVTAFAAYLCYNCNKKENIILRCIYLILAIMLSPYYLLYYVVYHFIFKEPCIRGFVRPGVPTKLI